MKNFIIIIISIIVFSCNAETIDSVLADINSGNVKEGIENLERLANNNDNVAQFQLGKLYYDGIKIERSYCNAHKWLLKSAENNNADAQLMVAVMYENGQGVFGDSAESLKWYEKASDKNNIAKYKLGSYLFLKNIDVDKAERLLADAGKSGIIDAYCVLGRNFRYLYYSGSSGKIKNEYKDKYLKYYTLAYELNDIEAIYMLNLSYDNIKVSVNDTRKASKYGLGNAFYMIYFSYCFQGNFFHDEISRVEAYKSMLIAEKLLGHNIRVEQKVTIDKFNFTKEEIEEATRQANEWKPIPLPPAPVVKNP